MNAIANKLDRLYIKAQVAAGTAKEELRKMREEDEGLDIIITIILVAVGLVLVGVIATYAQKMIDSADSGVGTATSAVGSLNTSVSVGGAGSVGN